MNAFGDWLEARRLERGWSMNTLCDRVGAPRSAVDRWLHGGTPSPANLFAVAKGLDVPMIDVLVAYLGLTADDLRGALARMTDTPQASPFTPGGQPLTKGGDPKREGDKNDD